MKLTQRQEKLLNTIIGEYIELAQPVSSQWLEKKYDFGICPATIRIEMQKLTDKGYLCISHILQLAECRQIKATDFLWIICWKKNLKIFEIGDWFASPLRENEIEDNIKFIQNLTKNLAHISGALALSYLDKEKVFWKEGWEEILKEPEFGEKDFAVNFAEFLENFENNIGDFEINSGIKIYIGKENPLKGPKDFSLISCKYHLPNEEGIISLVGPKRMAYDKNISLINSLTKLLENF